MTKELEPATNLEWNLLELLCLGIDEDKEERLFELLEADNIHFGELIEQAIRHHLLPLLAHTLERHCSSVQVPGRLRRFLRSHLDLNRHRNRVLTRESLQVLKTLQTSGIKVACTKGVVLQFTMYDDPAARAMFDVDMMILPQDRNRVTNIMADLGYVVGHYDWSTGSIIDLPRQTEIMYRLNPDHLPHYIRLTHQVPVPFVAIDFANSLTWTRSPWHVPMEEALAEITSVSITDNQELENEALPTLSVQYLFLFTVLHLFREAWFQRTAPFTKLAQFCDIVRLWSREKDALRNRLPTILEQHALVEPVAWVCEHTDSIFGTSIVRELCLQGQVSDKWLHSAYGLDGSNLTWVGTMRNRLSRKGEELMFEDIEDKCS